MAGLNDVTQTLRELGRYATTSVHSEPLRVATLRRIRRRQTATVVLTALVLTGVAVTSLAATIALTRGGSNKVGSTVDVAQSPPQISVTVGQETYTLTTFADAEGPALEITGEPDPNRIVGRLPVGEKLSVTDFWNGPALSEWAVLGFATSVATRVDIIFDSGIVVEATLFDLPSEVTTELKAFSAEASGNLGGYEVQVHDASGALIAREYREAPNGLPPSPESGYGSS